VFGEYVGERVGQIISTLSKPHVVACTVVQPKTTTLDVSLVLGGQRTTLFDECN
jgi:hypothetical protein